MKNKIIKIVIHIIIIISVSLSIYLIHDMINSDYGIMDRITSFVRGDNRAEDIAKTEIPSDEELEEMEAEVIRLTNEYRVSLGLNELTQDDQLAYVAQIRASEIVTTWSHIRPDGTIFLSILNDIQYPSIRAGENLGRAQKTASEVMDMWKESPSHNENLIGDFTKIGVDIYVSEDGILHFVQIFAK